MLAFSVQNLETITLKYYNFRFEIKTLSIPLIVLLLGSVFSGFFLAFLFGIGGNIKSKNIIRKKNQTIKNLDKKIAKLTLSSNISPGEQN